MVVELFNVRNGFTFEIPFSSDMQTYDRPKKPEYIICSITKDNIEQLLVLVFYWPPDVAFIKKNTDLENKLKEYCNKFSKKLIMGI